MQHEPLLLYTTCLYMLLSYTQHAEHADYADETILRDYAKLRGNYALQARGYASNLIEPAPSYPLHTKKTLLNGRQGCKCSNTLVMNIKRLLLVSLRCHRA